MENPTNRPAWPLLLLSAICLVAGWLFFAPLLFIWFTFLLRAYDLLKFQNEWKKFYVSIVTYILISISVIKIVDGSFAIVTVVHALILSVPFILHFHTEGRIVPRFSRVHIVIFWFALQYVSLHLFTSPSLFFLADSPSLPDSWVHWNTKTGFLGASLWIFIVNGLFYSSFPLRSVANWVYLGLAVISIVIPIILSHNMENPPLTAQDMLLLYQGTYQERPNYDYSDFGEIIARTSAWISVLVLIFTLVKIKTRKN